MHFLVLVNDSPTCFFSNSRGSRQGNPLSPLLFVIVMEALGRMIPVVVSGSLLFGFLIVTGTNISHLLFVDDALLFCVADPTEFILMF